jgi:hypothetical protein
MLAWVPRPEAESILSAWHTENGAETAIRFMWDADGMKSSVKWNSTHIQLLALAIETRWSQSSTKRHEIRRLRRSLAGVLALDHGASRRHYDQLFVGRNYFRIENFAAASRQHAPLISRC